MYKIMGALPIQSTTGSVGNRNCVPPFHPQPDYWVLFWEQNTMSPEYFFFRSVEKSQWPSLYIPTFLMLYLSFLEVIAQSQSPQVSESSGFSGWWNKIPHKQLKKEKVYFGSQFEGIELVIEREVWLAPGSQGNWPHCIYNQEADADECWCTD